MKPRQKSLLAVAALLLLSAGLWLSLHRSGSQSALGGSTVFADLEQSLAEVAEIRLSKGDGSKTTLRKSGNGWTVVEREYPADGTRVRELALALANLRVVEAKTQNPDNYAKLGVEAPDTATATSTLVEVVAGGKTWSLIVGKGADGRAVYVRKPAEKGSLLASPFFTADPDQKRWIDRLITDLPGASVHDITVQAGKSSYLLRRAQRGADLTLASVPRGRTALGALSLGAQAESLASFHFDDLRPLPSPAPAATDKATYRTFDGQVIELAGRRDGDKAYVTVNARRDAALAAQFAPPPADAAAQAKNAAAAATTPPPAEDKTTERLATRTQGVEYEIPVYKYEGIFKPLDQLLEPKG
jgi:hypothetical protein